MIIKRLFISLFIAVFSAGCTSAYVVKESSPKAMLRLLSNENGTTALNYINGGIFRVASTRKNGALFIEKEISPIQMLGTSSEEEASIRERTITADAPFSFEVFYFLSPTQYSYGYTCTLKGEFYPLEGEQYELHFKRCSVQLYKLSLAMDGSIERTAAPIKRQNAE